MIDNKNRDKEEKHIKNNENALKLLVVAGFVEFTIGRLNFIDVQYTMYKMEGYEKVWKMFG